MQSYEKSRAEQKILIFFMPRRSKFAIFDGKVMTILQQHQIKNIQFSSAPSEWMRTNEMKDAF